MSSDPTPTDTTPMAPSDVPDDAFVRVLSQALRGRRRSIGWTLERMAQHASATAERPIAVETLARFEAGTVDAAHRDLIAPVASSYDVDLAGLDVPRKPVTIEEDAFVIRDVRVPWYSDHIDDILVAFLEAIRRVRGNAEVEVASFRRVDIEAIADHFGRTPTFVLERLGELVGATDTRQAAMTTLYRSGGNLIPTGVEDDLDDAPQPAATSRLAAMLSGVE